MRRRSGFTLVELLVTLSIFGFLLSALWAVYQMGSRAWLNGDAHSDLLRQLNVVVGQLEREVNRSIYASATVDPSGPVASAVAFLSDWDPVENRPNYDAVKNLPVWSAYEICYFDAPDSQVCWRELDNPGTPSLPTSTPVPLPGLSGYRTAGKELATEVSLCEFRVSLQVLEVTLQAQRQADQVQVTSLLEFRN